MSTRPVSAFDLHNAIAAVAPIEGVARLANGSIRIDFKPEATVQQRQAANGITASWDWDAEVQREATVEERLAIAEARLAQLDGPAGP